MGQSMSTFAIIFLVAGSCTWTYTLTERPGGDSDLLYVGGVLNAIGIAFYVGSFYG